MPHPAPHKLGSVKHETTRLWWVFRDSVKDGCEVEAKTMAEAEAKGMRRLAGTEPAIARYRKTVAVKR